MVSQITHLRLNFLIITGCIVIVISPLVIYAESTSIEKPWQCMSYDEMKEFGQF
ncbi:MAG: hypothetical protein NPMRD1_160006 [Nitrosopumilales archaeon]|nr:MAG: hypothetical protein NPMRD1_160006 [Nitrosopumilales archaeon]